MIMRQDDHREILNIELDLPTLYRAARLGGLPIALDDTAIRETDGSMDLVRFFARRGITNAIHGLFDLRYPPRYPDDLDGKDNHTTIAGLLRGPNT